MLSISVTELKERADEIVREVHTRRAEFVVTHRGRAVARLIAADAPVDRRAEVEAWLAELDELTAEIERLAPEPTTTEEIIREMRRDI